MSFEKCWPVVSCLFCQLLDKCFLIIKYETYLSIYDKKIYLKRHYAMEIKP